MSQTHIQRALACALPVVLCLVTSSAAHAQVKPATKAKAPAKASALDDALLEDLDNELLDGVKDLPEKNKPGKASENADGDAAGDAEETMGDAAQGESVSSQTGDEEPLIRIGERMRNLEKRIDRQLAGEKTRHLQQQVVNDLEELIKQIQQQQSQSQSSSSSQKQTPGSGRESVKQPEEGQGKASGQASNQPAKESTERLGRNKTDKPDPEAVRSLLKDAWGQLPPHTREQMLQSPPEQFLPKYELLIEKYYKRLAEEQNKKP